MPPEVADHVAAVALFGKPSEQFMDTIQQPPITIGPLYAAKTIDLCVPNDAVCSGAGDFFAHSQYVEAGMVDQAADFAASHLPTIPVSQSVPTPPVTPFGPAPHLSGPPHSPGGVPADVRAGG
jgi:cutinase